MSNCTWVFGETSDFSKTILKKLKDRADPIKVFGRKNISYDKPAIEQLDFNNLPNRIIINIKLDALRQTSEESNFECWENNIHIIEFISDLLNQCKKSKKDITVVYITSSVTIIESMKEEDFYKWKKYIAIRHMQQAMWSAYDRKHLKVLAISPSNLTNSNKQDYAKRIVNIVYNPPKRRKCILDLSGAGEWRSLYIIDNIHYSVDTADVRYGIDK